MRVKLNEKSLRKEDLGISLSVRLRSEVSKEASRKFWLQLEPNLENPVENLVLEFKLKRSHSGVKISSKGHQKVRISQMGPVSIPF